MDRKLPDTSVGRNDIRESKELNGSTEALFTFLSVSESAALTAAMQVMRECDGAVCDVQLSVNVCVRVCIVCEWEEGYRM